MIASADLASPAISAVGDALIIRDIFPRVLLQVDRGGQQPVPIFDIHCAQDEIDMRLLRDGVHEIMEFVEHQEKTEIRRRIVAGRPDRGHRRADPRGVVPNNRCAARPSRKPIAATGALTS